MSTQTEIATTKKVFIERWNDEVSHLRRLGSSIKNVETFDELLSLQEQLWALVDKVATECFGE